MSELRKRRVDSMKARPGDPMLLGVGSVINPRELQMAIEMGFDMIVGPDSGMGGCRERIDFVKIVRGAKCFGVPGTFSPSEFAYFLEREDGLEPDGIKIFNASVYGPSGVGALLAPYQRDRHNGKLVMPTGGVGVKTGPGFQEQISKRGFCPVLGMSAPLELVTRAEEDRRPGHDPRVAGQVQGRIPALQAGLNGEQVCARAPRGPVRGPVVFPADRRRGTHECRRPIRCASCRASRWTASPSGGDERRHRRPDAGSRNPLAGRPPRPRAYGSRRGGRPRPLRPGVREGALRHDRGGGSPGRHRLRAEATLPDSYGAVLDSGRIGIRRRDPDARPLPRGPGSHPDARRQYGDTVPVLSSMLGPFTLSGCLFGVETLLIWMIEEPDKVQVAMTLATRLVALYVRAQFEAGAHVVQMAEPTASGDLISPAQYLEHVAPYHRELASCTDRPLITHICGNITRHLPHLAAAGFRGVSFDAKTDIQAAKTHLKGKAALIGYVPTGLLREGSPAEVRAAARQCITEGVDALNAGCAVAPDTPIDNIKAMIAAAARRWELGNRGDWRHQANRYVDPEGASLAARDRLIGASERPVRWVPGDLPEAGPLKTVRGRRSRGGRRRAEAPHRVDAGARRAFWRGASNEVRRGRPIRTRRTDGPFQRPVTSGRTS